MRKKIVLMVFITSIISACNGDRQLPKRSSDIVCTADVNVCADGHYVRRDPLNNCAFYACNAAKILQECSINTGCAPNINLLKH
jgi:hypothetical protein